jgi:hypothetical protein
MMMMTMMIKWRRKIDADRRSLHSRIYEIDGKCRR